MMFGRNYEATLTRRRVRQAIGGGLVAFVAARLAIGLQEPKVHIPERQPVPNNTFDRYDRAAKMLDADAKAIGTLASEHQRSPQKPVPAYLAQAEKLTVKNQAILGMLGEPPRPTGECCPFPFRLPPVQDFSAEMPYLNRFRTLGQFLILEGDVCAAHGNHRAAIAWYTLAIDLGGKVTQGATLIGFLSGLAIERMGYRALERELPRYNGTAAEWADTSLRFQAGTPHASCADALTEEKYLGQRSFQRFFADPGGYLQQTSPDLADNTPFRIAAPLAPMLFAVWSKREIMTGYTDYLDAQIALSHRPYRRDAQQPPLPRDLLNQIILPVFNHIYFMDRRVATERALLEAQFAIREATLEKGALPTELKGYPDPFSPTGADLQYRRTKTGYVLYSVGPDGKDDGGKPITDRKRGVSEPPSRSSASLSHRVEEDNSGDWVAGVNE